MAHTVTEVEVAAYRGMCTQIARRYDGLGGAEFDDLEQEGWIAAWEVLERGRFKPSALVVERACVDWVRYCGRRGFSHESLPEE